MHLAWTQILQTISRCNESDFVDNQSYICVTTPVSEWSVRKVMLTVVNEGVTLDVANV